MEALFDAQLAACENGNFEFSTLAGAYSGNLEYFEHRVARGKYQTIFSQSTNRTNLACADRRISVHVVQSPSLSILAG